MSTSEASNFLPPIMSVAQSAPPVAALHAATHSHRFSVDQYHRMIEMGVLTEDDEVELLEGWITDMMTPLGTDHSTGVCLAQIYLQRLVAPGWYLAVEQSIVHADSEPQPDLTIVRGDPRDRSRTGSHPHGDNVGLVVEVSDTSLQRDRLVKLPIYAAAGIPEYWIVNLPERKLEVYRKPMPTNGEQAAKYETVEVLSPEQAVEVVLDGIAVGSINVREILP